MDEDIIICPECNAEIWKKYCKVCTNCFACTGCEVYICDECKTRVSIKPIQPMNLKEKSL